MENDGRHGGSKALACVLIAVVGLLTYANSITGEFVWDDVSSVLIHQDVKDPNRVAQLFQKDQHAFGRGDGSFFRPLLSLTFMIDYQIASIGRSPADLAGIPKISPVVFHLTSIAWHIAAALALFFLLRAFRAPYIIQWAVAAVYAVHPLHTEAVAYISGRGDSMAAAFLFTGIALAAGMSAGRDGVIFRSLLIGLCVLAASLSKESGMMIVPLLIWTACCLGMVSKPRKGEPSLVLRLAPLATSAAALLVYFMLRRNAVGGAGDDGGTTTALSQRLVETLQSLAMYGKLMVLPTNLHMERTLDGVPMWYAGVGAMLLVGLLALLIVSWRRGDTRITMACGLFLIAWFPISGIIPLNAPLAEHWMYVPMAGVLWVAGEWIHRGAMAWGRPLAAPVFAGIAVLILLPMSVERNADWRNNVTLFEATLRENPSTLRVRQNLAIAQESEMENLPAAQRAYQNVAAYYDRTRQEGTPPSPQELEVHLSLGTIFLETGRPDMAQGHFQRVLTVSDDARYREYTKAAVTGFARALVDQGDVMGAERFLLQWIEPIPELAVATWEIMGGRSLAFQQRR